MHATALVKGLDHVCCRYRLAAFRSAFARAGWELELRPWPKSWLSRLLLRRHLGRPDLLIVQRKLPAAWQLSLLRQASGRLAFDFDDAVFLRDSFAPRGCHCPRRARAFANVVRAADVVIAGNAFLRGQASLWTPTEKVLHIPTCIDLDRYELAEHRRWGASIRLAWIGSSSTLRGLEQARPLLEALGKSLPGLALKVICDRFPTFQHLPVLPCPWSGHLEAAELRTADVGLSWLPDDLWSRGKCGLKVLQYMAAGLPVVANPVGLQAELVQDGETGFLVSTAADLIRAVACLAHDPPLRRRLGRQGREVVRKRFSLTVGQRSWLKVLGALQEGLSAQNKTTGRPREEREVAKFAY
jgi:glycosyltransferase involved in cell wall biosynthesis